MDFQIFEKISQLRGSLSPSEAPLRIVEYLHAILELSVYLRVPSITFYDIIDTINNEFIGCCEIFFAVSLGNGKTGNLSDACSFFAAVKLVIIAATNESSTLERQMKSLPASVTRFFLALLEERNDKYLLYLIKHFESNNPNIVDQVDVLKSTLVTLPTPIIQLETPSLH